MDPGLAHCRRIVARAMEIGWLDAAALRDLARELERGEDPVVQELRFEHVGHHEGGDRASRLRVALLDDAAECGTAELLGWIRTLLRRGRP